MKLQTGWYERIHDGNNQVPIHRLVAVAEYGFDAAAGNDIHHKNGVKWDNRPSNIEVLSRGEHVAVHSTNRDNYADHDTPYRDEDVLRELYVERGMSVYEIADKWDCSRKVVGDWVRKYGLGTRRTNRAYRDEDVLRDLYVDQEMTLREVADELNAARNTIRRWLNRHDIGIRSPGRPPA